MFKIFTHPDPITVLSQPDIKTGISQQPVVM